MKKNSIYANDSRAAFLERHDRLLSFLGALIVFLTFITKDQLHDKWRGVAESLETAQYFYSVRVSTTEPTTPVDIERRLSLSELGANLDSKPKKEFGSKYETLLAEGIKSKKENESLAIRIDNLYILADKLPHPELYEPQLGKLCAGGRFWRSFRFERRFLAARACCDVWSWCSAGLKTLCPVLGAMLRALPDVCGAGRG